MQPCRIPHRLSLLCLLLLSQGAGSDLKAGARTDGLATGDGVVVAVVGGGIDYSHAAFGGAGTVGAYAANDPRLVEGDFPNAKVIGGYDFAGSHYSAACAEPADPDTRCHRQPVPDSDPLESAGGSGTRMAGLVAGLPTAELPAGLAPEASLIALKVRGDPERIDARSDLYDDAIDWVIAHNAGRPVPGVSPSGKRIDIILLEAAEPWGGGQRELTEAVDRAVAASITVIAGVGDSTAANFSAAGTSLPQGMVSVGAAVDKAPSSWGIRVSYSGEDGSPVFENLEAIEGGDWLPQLAAVGPIETDLALYGLACGDTPPAQEVREKVALIARGTCPFVEKMENAAAAGAVAVVMYTDNRGKLSLPCGNPCTSTPGIVGVMIDNAPGAALQARLETGHSLSVLLDADYIFEQGWLRDTMVSTSAGGPHRLGTGILPSIVAAGEARTVAVAGSGSAAVSWTSSQAAAAGVAGMAALLVQDLRDAGLDPGGPARLTVAQMLVEHGQPKLHIGRSDTGPVAPVSRQGGGILSIADLEDARSALAPVDLNFGLLRVARDIEPGSEAAMLLERSIRLGSLDAAPRRFWLAFVLRDSDEDANAGLRVSLASQTLDSAPMGASEVRLGLDVQVAGLRDWDLPAGTALVDAAGLERHAIDGHLQLHQIDAQDQRIADGENLAAPLLVIPRKSSCVESLSGGADDAEAGERILLSNPCLASADLRLARLLGQDPQEFEGRDAAEDIRAVGLRYGPSDPADPRSAGMLEFFVATWGKRLVPVGTAIDLLLDIDRDGSFDRVLTTVDGAEIRSAPARRWFTVNAPLIPGSLEPDLASATASSQPLEYDLDESVSRLRANADDLRLDFASGEEAFDFAVRIRDIGGENRSRSAGDLLADAAPDGLADGERYHFDQRRDGCWMVATSDGGRPDRFGEVLNIPGQSDDMALQITAVPDCDVDAAAPARFLFHVADNVSALEQAILWPGDDDRPQPIYLPFGLRNVTMP